MDKYVGEACYNATKAAELAGFKHPRVTGSKFKRLLRQVIEERGLVVKEQASMSAVEVIEGLTEIARDKSHKDRKAALDTLAKVHGLLTDKLDLKLDRKQLATELEGVVGRMLELAPTVKLLPSTTSMEDEDVIT